MEKKEKVHEVENLRGELRNRNLRAAGDFSVIRNITQGKQKVNGSAQLETTLREFFASPSLRALYARKGRRETERGTSGD